MKCHMDEEWRDEFDEVEKSWETFRSVITINVIIFLGFLFPHNFVYFLIISENIASEKFVTII